MRKRYKRWAAVTNPSFGPLGKHLDEFSTRLSSLGHTQGTIKAKMLIARHLNKWLHQKRLKVRDLNEKSIGRFLGCYNNCTFQKIDY